MEENKDSRENEIVAEPYFKGKGEHSVFELEKMLAEYKEFTYQIRLKNQKLEKENQEMNEALEESVHNDTCTWFMEKAIALKKSLVEAKSLIRSFHGPMCWDIYDAQSPEMKRINKAIEDAPSFEIEDAINEAISDYQKFRKSRYSHDPNPPK